MGSAMRAKWRTTRISSRISVVHPIGEHRDITRVIYYSINLLAYTVPGFSIRRFDNSDRFSVMRLDGSQRPS